MKTFNLGQSLVGAQQRYSQTYKGIAMPLICGIITTATPGPYGSALFKEHIQTSPSRYNVGQIGIDAPFTKRGSSNGGTEGKAPELAKEFFALVEQWEQETFHHSSLSKIFTHPAYVRIMAMGKEAIPLVLNELRNKPGHWFYALKFMAGKDIAAGTNNFEDARAAWLEWGYNNNYI